MACGCGAPSSPRAPASVSSAAPAASGAAVRPRRTKRRRPFGRPLALTLLLAPVAFTGGYRVPYPSDVFVCERGCPLDPPVCPGQTCPAATKKGACDRYITPTSDHDGEGRGWTYCQYDFQAACTDDRLGCPRCALRYIATRKCDAAERCVRPSKDYVVLPSREGNETVGLCFTNRQIMVVPTRPCTGIESRDPRCTGRQGEKYWAYAWKAALDAGHNPYGPSNAQWGVVLNPINARSQHQAHFRIAPTLFPPGGVMERMRAQRRLSTQAKRPTFSWGVQSDLAVSVFVPGDVTDPSTLFSKVRPFERGSLVAHAAMPLSAYGILVTPWKQPAEPTWGSGPSGGAAANVNVTGFAVTAYFNLRGTLLLDETVSVINSQTCQARCAIFGAAAAASSSSSASAATAAAAGADVHQEVSGDPGSDTALFGLY